MNCGNNCVVSCDSQTLNHFSITERTPLFNGTNMSFCLYLSFYYIFEQEIVTISCSGKRPHFYFLLLVRKPERKLSFLNIVQSAETEALKLDDVSAVQFFQ